jgi:RNA polymerase sigma factor (TIGR02999 family)
MTDLEIPAEDTLSAPPETQRMARELLPILYADLRRIARRERFRINAGATMQTTALIHDAYLKMQNVAAFNDRQHFLRASALAMRHVLLGYVRERMTDKRGSGTPNLPLDEAPEVAGPGDETLLEVDDALKRLGLLNPRLAQVVECRFFAGYSETETALALGLTDRTVRRDWVKARAWLRRELGSGAEVLPGGES